MIFIGRFKPVPTSYNYAGKAVFGANQGSRHKFELNFAPSEKLSQDYYLPLAAPQLVSVTIPFVNTNIDCNNVFTSFTVINDPSAVPTGN